MLKKMKDDNFPMPVLEAYDVIECLLMKEERISEDSDLKSILILNTLNDLYTKIPKDE